MPGHWIKDFKMREQHSITGEIRDARTTRNHADVNPWTDVGASNPSRIDRFGKLIGYGYRARAIARRRTHS